MGIADRTVACAIDLAGATAMALRDSNEREAERLYREAELIKLVELLLLGSEGSAQDSPPKNAPSQGAVRNDVMIAGHPAGTHLEW